MLYVSFCQMNDVEVAEIEKPLREYQSFGKLFARHLKEGSREIAQDELVSPVDGKALVFGAVGEDGVLEQIKGQEYGLEEFLGRSYQEIGVQPGNQLYYCVIYLAPRNYHRIHSPTEWQVGERAHYPGVLMSVSPAIVERASKVFVRNERVVLLGEWKHGFFSMSPVGATNVGSIALSAEPEFRSNLPIDAPEQEAVDRLLYDQVQVATKGQEMAAFHAGSTVVLVFESPPFQFDLTPFQPVRLGQPLGHRVEE